MSDREVLGYRLRMDVEKPIADFLMTSPYDAFALILMQCRRPWDGEKYIHMHGRTMNINWRTINYPIYHPLCIDASFFATDPVTHEKFFSGEIRSYRMPDPDNSIECLSADRAFKKKATVKSIRSISRRIYDWSDGSPDIARVLTIFAGQVPFHPFWRMKNPGGPVMR